jgi:pimeloyl-ACP methyl ester carboxylesterase
VLPLPELAGVRHDFVDLSTGVRAHVAQAGPEDAPPLLLLHGWPQHWYVWRGVIPRLADRHRLICPDNRGFGWTSAPPDGDFRKPRIADDAIAVLDALGIERAGLVGHDWGGWAGWFLCLDAPERIRAFLALNIIHPWQPRRRLLATAWRLYYQWLLSAPVVGERLLRDGRRLRGALRPFIDEAALDAYLDVLDPAASVQLYRQFVLRDAPALAAAVRSRRIDLPVRLLFGRDDAAQDPRQLRGLRAHAPDSAIELVDASHWIVDERPDLVADRARALFAPGVS